MEFGTNGTSCAFGPNVMIWAKGMCFEFFNFSLYHNILATWALNKYIEFFGKL
jgi:hypothetical protein